MSGDDALARFRRSMQIGPDEWRDGVGYDLAALRAMSDAERATIEAELSSRADRDWRDVEALAALDSEGAKAALRSAWHGGSDEIRLAVLRHAPDVVDRSDRVSTIVRGLEEAELFGGFRQAMEQAALFHPPPVLYALHRAILRRDGEKAVLLAGLLWHVAGRSDELFDWAKRPLFLELHTADRDARTRAYHELCRQAGIHPLAS